MPIVDRYDGITIGDFCTERWLEVNAVLSRNLGKAYWPVYNPAVDAQDPGVKNLGVDDDSKVYEIKAAQEPVFVAPAGGLDVNIQDQTSPIVITKVSRLKFEDQSLALAAVKEARNVFVEIADIGNFVAGDLITIFSIPDNRFYQGKALVVNGGTGEITLDTPLDFAYPVTSYITSATTNLAVDGSSTPVIFGVRNTVNRIPSKVDITRIIITATMDDNGDFSEFLNIPIITNGLVARRVDGEITNYFNVKSNKELTALMYDFQLIDTALFGGGQAGAFGRLTFAGQNKIGVVVRLEEDDDFQIVIQDDLTITPGGDGIDIFEITVEGHLVVD